LIIARTSKYLGLLDAALNPWSLVLPGFQRAVRTLRGLNLGVLPTLRLYNSQVFSMLAHTLQVYPPSDALLHAEKYALQLFFAAPSSSIDSQALVHLKLLGFHTRANSIAFVNQAAKMRVSFNTSKIFFANQQKIELADSTDDLILHWSPDIAHFLNHNIMTNLNLAQAIAMNHSLHCSRTYQAKATIFVSGHLPTTTSAVS
jgi:hypothetical protein